MKKKTVSFAFALTLLTLLMLVGFARATVGPVEFVTTITLDRQPNCVAFNEGTNQVYVGTENGLLVIDGTTDTVVTEILPDADVRTIVFNPQTNRIYASDWPNRIVIIDSATNQQVGEIPEYTYKSTDLAINPVTNLIYIVDVGVFIGDFDRILVYDMETNTLVTRVNIPGSNEHEYMESVGVAVNPETNLIYATWSGDHTLHVIDGNTNSIIQTVSTSSFSRSSAEKVEVNPYTNCVYIGKVVVDCESLVEVSSDYPGYVEAVDPVNNLIYTIGYDYGHTQNFDYYLWVLNGTTHDEISSFEIEWLDWISHTNDCLGVTCNTGKIYLVNSYENEVPVMVVPEFHTLMSAMLVLFVVAVAFLIYTRTVSEEPAHKQS
jgi:DNA-binding beta-propeller fold protein YncE